MDAPALKQSPLALGSIAVIDAPAPAALDEMILGSITQPLKRQCPGANGPVNHACSCVSAAALSPLAASSVREASPGHEEREASPSLEAELKAHARSHHGAAAAAQAAAAGVAAGNCSGSARNARRIPEDAAVAAAVANERRRLMRATVAATTGSAAPPGAPAAAVVATVADDGQALAGILADEDTFAELQVILNKSKHSAGTTVSPETSCPQHRESSPSESTELQAILSRAKHDTVASPVKVNIRESLPPAPDESSATRNITPAQALDLARHQIRSARTMPTYSERVLCANGVSERQSADAETEAVIRTLAHSLGAHRTEAGTIKTLHSVLLQLETPGMTQDEAIKLTGAAKSSHSKWRNKVLKVGTMRNGEIGLRRWSSPVPSMDQAAPCADHQLAHLPVWIDVLEAGAVGAEPREARHSPVLLALALARALTSPV